MKDKIILDLCGGTGAWSRPYKQAGYDVRVITKPLFDVTKFIAPHNVYGIFAAPPCTQFSFARTNAKKERDLEAGFIVVKACLEIIWNCRMSGSLKFWAMENPKGYLRQFLGKPYLEFSPEDYGDEYQKKTDIWGYFNKPVKTPIVITLEKKAKFATHSQDLHNVEIRSLFTPDAYVPDTEMDFRAIRRSVTPAGFAEAFFKANR